MNDAGTWSLGGLQQVGQCPACGGSKREPTVFERRDNEGLMEDRWRMVRCADCGSIWLDPRPDAQSLPRAYEHYYTHDADVDDVNDSGGHGLAWRAIRGYLNRRFGMRKQPANALGYPLFSMVEPWRLKLDYYGRHLTRVRFPLAGHLLDIGCGNGAFLARAVDMGWKVMGCEPDPKAVARCRSGGLDVVEGDAFHAAVSGMMFDVITISHVLEHVDDQSALLQRAFQLLRPGGMIWVGLPNPASIGLRVFGSAWHGLHPPYHLCIPSQHVLAGWMRDAGFAEIHFLRRGAHVRRVWSISRQIAARERLSAPTRFAQVAWRAWADGMATFSSRRAEETVVIAYKPRTLRGN